MAVKIRLKRIGKKRNPHYRIVVADSKTHRDGRVIEEIGRYVPTTDPSIIEVNSERAQYWLSVGAQPTEPAAVILKLTGDVANEKGEKKNTVKPQATKETFAADTKKKSVILPKEEKKPEPVKEETPVAEAPAEAPVAEETAVAEETSAEAPAEPAAEATEAPAAEAPAEAPVEETPAEPAAEAPAEEAPAAEAAEEAPAEAPASEEAPAEEAPAAEAAEEPKSE
ncbi:MAG: 30S ribosomal protein S16 [Actinobacteria bacterium]|nr:30S ribosomal protein S16 [Actinomycetota bacterium]NCX64506.1 30S ribosomal protein S16 [Actinomycetota bacterium]